jgi:hypothetical protein
MDALRFYPLSAAKFQGKASIAAPGLSSSTALRILALVPFDELLSRLDKGLKGSAYPRAEEGCDGAQSVAYSPGRMFSRGFSRLG